MPGVSKGIGQSVNIGQERQEKWQKLQDKLDSTEFDSDSSFSKLVAKPIADEVAQIGAGIAKDVADSIPGWIGQSGRNLPRQADVSREQSRDARKWDSSHPLSMQGRPYKPATTSANRSYWDTLRESSQLDPRFEQTRQTTTNPFDMDELESEDSNVTNDANVLDDADVIDDREYESEQTGERADAGGWKPARKKRNSAWRYQQPSNATVNDIRTMSQWERVNALQDDYNASRDNQYIAESDAVRSGNVGEGLTKSATKRAYERRWEALEEHRPDLVAEIGYNRLEPMFEESDYLEQYKSQDNEEMQQYYDKQVKENEKQKKNIDSYVSDMMRGFIHLPSQHVGKDPVTGQPLPRYSHQVERATFGLANYFGLYQYYGGDVMAAQRTIHRAVRHYAGISTDRQGNVFVPHSDSSDFDKMEADEWSLTDEEFVMICGLIYKSCQQYGHPFAMAYYLAGEGRRQLRGTDMYPIGYLPDMLAVPLMNENSNLYNPETGMTTPQALKDAVMKEYKERTRPAMESAIADALERERREKRRNGKGRKIKYMDKDGKIVKARENEIPGMDTWKTSDHLIMQRAILDDINQASARLDGIDAEEFSRISGVDTAQHYRLSELSDMSSKYAVAMEGVPDAMVDDVLAREKEKIDREKARISKRRKRKAGPAQLCGNIIVAGAKTNALFWQVPILLSAIVEKGVGDLQTWITLKSSARALGLEESKVELPEDMKQAFDNKDAYEVVDAAMILLEVGGPTALPMFGKWCAENNRQCNHQDVMEFLRSETQRLVSDMALPIEKFNERLSQIQQKILTGKYAFYKQSNRNFLMALMLSSAVQEQAMNEAIEKGAQIGSPVFTTDQLRDAWIANSRDPMRFMTDAISYAGTRDALIMMRANNIGQFNPVSFMVKRTLADHGVTNAVLTVWVDTFIPYGINFAMTMLPMSKTLTYLACKGLQWNGKANAADFAIGGGMSGIPDQNHLSSPGFIQGLKMNLMFDCVTLGKWGLMGLFLGGALAAIGFGPPPDDDDFYNISMWRIGKNLGWGPDTDGDGKGDGIEVQEAFWLNDLTQFGLPIAKVLAAGIWASKPGNEVPSSVKPGWQSRLFMDSLYDQFDGNVVLDVIDTINTWQESMDEYHKMLTDPNYEGPSDLPSIGWQSFFYKAGEKLTPGAPLYAAWGRSALLRGSNARMYDPYKVYDQTEWGLSVGKTNYVYNTEEARLRNSTARNWLLALIMNKTRTSLDTGNLDSLTGYFWFQMPPKTRADQMTLAYMDQFKVDYDNMPPGMSENTYNHLKASILEDAIAQQVDVYGTPEAAVANGFFIPHDIRVILLDEKYSEIKFLKNELEARKQAGWVPSDIWNAYQDKIDEDYKFIETWLKNDAVPTYNKGYEQLLTDKDVSFVHEDGSPATRIESIFDATVKAVWHNKGNHPASIYPITRVDYSSNYEVTRDPYGETVNYWYDDGKTDLDSIKNGIGKKILTVGRDAGKTLNDSLFDQNVDGSYRHPDYPTMNDRAWVKQLEVLPDDIMGYTEEDASGGIYGESGKGENTLAAEAEGKTTPAAGVGIRGSSGSNSGTPASGGSGGKNSGAGMGVRSSGKSKGGSGSGKSMTPQDALSQGGLVGGAVAGAMGNVYQTIINKQFDGDNKTTNITNGGNSYYPTKVYSRRYYGGGGGGYDYNPKIYSNPHSLYSSKPATMYSKTPYSTRNQTYLRPSFSTKGSREAYKRQDF